MDRALPQHQDEEGENRIIWKTARSLDKSSQKRLENGDTRSESTMRASSSNLSSGPSYRSRQEEQQWASRATSPVPQPHWHDRNADEFVEDLDENSYRGEEDVYGSDTGSHLFTRIAPQDVRVSREVMQIARCHDYFRTLSPIRGPRYRDDGQTQRTFQGLWPSAVVRGIRNDIATDADEDIGDITEHNDQPPRQPRRFDRVNPVQDLNRHIPNAHARGQAIRDDTKEERDLNSTKQHVDSRDHKKSSETRTESHTPKRPRTVGKTVERQTGSRASESGYRISALSDRPPDAKYHQGESVRRSRSSSRDQSNYSSTRIASIDKICDAAGDYKRQKNLKQLAEKRKREMRGVVTGDPTEDDVLERRKRLSRRRGYL